MRKQAGRIVAILFAGALMLFATQALAEGDEVSDLFELSFGLESQGNYKTALNNVLKILRQDRANYTATLRAGWLYYLLGEHENAVEYYKKAIDLAPGSIEPKLGVMLPYMAVSNWPEAEKYAREVLKAAPAEYYASSRLAWILYSQGRYSEALDTYKKVQGWYPSDIEMQLGVGWTCVKMGKKEEARQAFQKVLDVRRSNIRALQGMEAVSK